MILYHVRFDLEDTSRKFTPRPPEYALIGEDKEVARVCVSSSIEGAVSACPSGSDRLKFCQEVQSGLMVVFKIDSEKLNLSRIITPDKLSDFGVEDAYWTDEHWILEEFEVPEEDIHVHTVKSWNVNTIRLEGGGCPYIHLVHNLELETVGDCSEEGRRHREVVIHSEWYSGNAKRFLLVYNDPIQAVQIRESMESGVDLASIVDRRFSYKQMREIRLGLEEGLDASLYASHAIDFQAMFSLRKALRQGLDIAEFVYPEVSYADINEYIKRNIAHQFMTESSVF